MSCNCSAPLVGGSKSRKRYQVGRTKSRSSSRSRRGGGWFSSIFGSSDETEEKKDEGGFFGLFGKSSSAQQQVPYQQQNTRFPGMYQQQNTRLPGMYQQPAIAGGSRRRAHRRGGKHCKTSQYKVGGKTRRRSRK